MDEILTSQNLAEDARLPRTPVLVPSGSRWSRKISIMLILSNSHDRLRIANPKLKKLPLWDSFFNGGGCEIRTRVTFWVNSLSKRADSATLPTLRNYVSTVSNL